MSELEAAPKTQLDAFLRQFPLPAGVLARRAEMADQYLSELRTGGVKNPQAKTIGRIRRAASELLGREVQLEELFVFEG